MFIQVCNEELQLKHSLKTTPDLLRDDKKRQLITTFLSRPRGVAVTCRGRVEERRVDGSDETILFKILRNRH